MLDAFPPEHPDVRPTKRRVDLEGFVSESDAAAAQPAPRGSFVEAPPPAQPVWRTRTMNSARKPAATAQRSGIGSAVPVVKLPVPAVPRKWLVRGASAIAIFAIVAGTLSARRNLQPSQPSATQVSASSSGTIASARSEPVAASARPEAAAPAAAPVAAPVTPGNPVVDDRVPAASKPSEPSSAAETRSAKAPVTLAARTARVRPSERTRPSARVAAARESIPTAGRTGTRGTAGAGTPTVASSAAPTRAPAPRITSQPNVAATVSPPSAAVPRAAIPNEPRNESVPIPPPAAAAAPASPPAASAVVPPPVVAENRVPEAVVSRNTIPDEPAIRGVLNRYQAAYERLDAQAAKQIWPTVNERALARAFSGLESQSMTFDQCRISVATNNALASCRGSASYVGRVGSKSGQRQNREWTFRLRKAGEGWQIDSVQLN
jgi:hypothetical protein